MSIIIIKLGLRIIKIFYDKFMQDIIRNKQPKIDLTSRLKKELPPKRRKKRFLKLSIVMAIFFITVLTVFSSHVLVTDQSSTSWWAKLPIIKHIRHLAESADRQLKGDDRDRINILLLGMGGRGHDGAYLTDTIMLASLEPSTGKVALMSIPRDLTVPVENMGWKKINHINAFAETETTGSGGLAVSQAISDILQIPVNYYIRMDFAGFINIIDELDGVDVYVENTLDDYKYPVAGMEKSENYQSRFEHLYIEKGRQTMDGELALKYARSRQAVGVEGSDFARSKRQQKIIEAVKDKIISLHTLFKPSTITNIYSEFKNHISTNLKIWEMIKLWDKFKDVKKEDITNRVLDNSPNGLLVNTISEEGAYILIPRSGDFAEIQYFVNNVFTNAPMEIKTRVTKERAAVEVRNGTWINGLASQAALDLEKFGFIVVRIGNSSRQNFQKSVIYDLSYGEKSKSLSILKNKTGANVSLGMPQWLIDDINSDLTGEKDPVQPDFILILGQDADATGSGKENIVE